MPKADASNAIKRHTMIEQMRSFIRGRANGFARFYLLGCLGQPHDATASSRLALT